MKKMQIYKNGNLIDTLWYPNLAAAKAWVKAKIIFTHMGEWRKIKNGYEYATTVGAYYQFLKTGE
jgi:hypothetical protein